MGAGTEVGVRGRGAVEVGGGGGAATGMNFSIISSNLNRIDFRIKPFCSF